MYRDYPDDLRPSRLAEWMAHAGTALESPCRSCFCCRPRRPVAGGGNRADADAARSTSRATCRWACPSSGTSWWSTAAFALFWAHPDVHAWPPWARLPLAAFLVVMLVVIPLAGNLFPRPRLVSAGDALLRRQLGVRRLAVPRRQLPEARQARRRARRWVLDQLRRFYDQPTAVGLVGKVMGFRLMHLHGRALPLLVPQGRRPLRGLRIRGRRDRRRARAGLELRRRPPAP